MRSASATEPSASARTRNPSAGPPGKAPAAADTARSSRYSSAAAGTPASMTRAIAAHPRATSGWKAATGSCASGAGTRRSQAAVTIPRVPSEPHSRLTRSYPATSLRTGPPIRTSSPGARTTSRPVTQSPVTPYLNAWGPPALVAIVPPSWDCSAAPGSGANSKPVSRARRATVAVVTPASASMRHSAGSSDRTAESRSSATATMSSCNGAAPPAYPVRPPTGTMATSCA